MAKKLIVIAGATGNQGSAIARGLIKTGDWHIRAVTRNVNGEKAKKLAAEGMEVVQGDYNDEESMRKAFDVSYSLHVFFVGTISNMSLGRASHFCGNQLVGCPLQRRWSERS